MPFREPPGSLSVAGLDLLPARAPVARSFRSPPTMSNMGLDLGGGGEQRPDRWSTPNPVDVVDPAAGSNYFGIVLDVIKNVKFDFHLEVVAIDEVDAESAPVLLTITSTDHQSSSSRAAGERRRAMGPPRPPTSSLTGAGYRDVWQADSRRRRFNTCCQAPRLEERTERHERLDKGCSSRE